MPGSPWAIPGSGSGTARTAPGAAKRSRSDCPRRRPLYARVPQEHSPLISSSPYPRPPRADGGKSVIRIDRFILSHGSHTTPTPISRDKTQMSGAPHLPTQDFCRQVSRSASSTLPGAVLSLPLRVAGLPSTTYTTDNNNGTLTPITNAPRPPRRPARRAHARTHQGPGPDRARPRAQPQEAQASAHRRGQAGSRTARKYSC